MIFDTHIHTKFSSDCKMELAPAIAKAKELNIGLIITDHMDLNYPEIDKFHFDVADFFNTYGPHRNDALLLGIELGMDIDHKEENKKLAESYPFDEIIGSQHFVHKFNMYDPKVYEELSKKEIYIEYLLDAIASIKTHNYIDTFGHIDYICRYCTYEDRELHYKDYADYLDELIKLCVNYDIALEINSRRLNNEISFSSLKKIYTRYKELGGRYVTLGSDAHNVSGIGLNLDKGLYLAETTNLTPVYFKERNPQFIKK